MVNLAVRGIQVCTQCPVCSMRPETTIHALWGCNGVTQVRSDCYFLKGSGWRENTHFQDFFLFFVQILNSEELVLLCVILWRVWFWRNQKIHSPSTVRTEDVVSWATGFIDDYRSANKSELLKVSPHVAMCGKWCPP
ncbi:hypothetical protein Dsin_005159 [Dipteronia sinensis]|uniref:Reverse transcriptase zinc-binding domain-containing protein n=1 Tax=Dipteronia sinensis TaxID=43782 RepID=A0AAE0AXA7_9ROSI|nr:hypothetical protein Dsin_005159 [Dipteronia sinensis]